MTKLDKEIQEGLYDPKGKAKAKAVGRIKKKLTKAKGYDPKKPMSSKYKILHDKGETMYHLFIGDNREEYGRYRSHQAAKKAFEDWERDYDPKASVIPTRWYEAMVKGIKRSSDVRNPYAIVKNIWAKLSPSKRSEIKAREAKGEQFKYDLPLPVDKPTRGTGTVRMVKPFKLAEVQVNLSVADYLTALKSGIFSRMKRQDGTTALVARCKSPEKNVNIFVDKARK